MKIYFLDEQNKCQIIKSCCMQCADVIPMSIVTGQPRKLQLKTYLASTEISVSIDLL